MKMVQLVWPKRPRLFLVIETYPDAGHIERQTDEQTGRWLMDAPSGIQPLRYTNLLFSFNIIHTSPALCLAVLWAEIFCLLGQARLVKLSERRQLWLVISVPWRWLSLYFITELRKTRWCYPIPLSYCSISQSFLQDTVIFLKIYYVIYFKD